MQNTTERLLLIFIKNPQKGKVKTRLAATLGNEKALAIYKQLLNHTHQVVQSVQADKQLWYSDFIPESDDWDDTQVKKRIQHGNDLGQRMKVAFKRAFENNKSKVVIIGSDCAQLQPRHLEQAFDALKNNEAVIGPARDGGYYLLGMNRFIPALFNGKPWGEDAVLKQTITDFQRQNIKYKLLEKLNDIDTEKDWHDQTGSWHRK